MIVSSDARNPDRQLTKEKFNRYYHSWSKAQYMMKLGRINGYMEQEAKLHEPESPVISRFDAFYIPLYTVLRMGHGLE